MAKFMKKDVYRTAAGWVKRFGGKILGPFSTESEARTAGGISTATVVKKGKIPDNIKVVEKPKKESTVKTPEI